MMHDPIGPWPNAVFVVVYLLVIPYVAVGVFIGEIWWVVLVWAVATFPLHVAGVFGKGPWK